MLKLSVLGFQTKPFVPGRRSWCEKWHFQGFQGPGAAALPVVCRLGLCRCSTCHGPLAQPGNPRRGPAGTQVLQVTPAPKLHGFQGFEFDIGRRTLHHTVSSSSRPATRVTDQSWVHRHAVLHEGKIGYPAWHESRLGSRVSYSAVKQKACIVGSDLQQTVLK